MTKYKYTRKQAIELIRRDWNFEIMKNVLLAKEQGECKHEWEYVHETSSNASYFRKQCSKCGYGDSTTPPLKEQRECKHDFRTKDNGVFSWVECSKCGKQDGDLLTYPTSPTKEDVKEIEKIDWEKHGLTEAQEIKWFQNKFDEIIDVINHLSSVEK